MRASAGAYPRDQPFRRHHDCDAARFSFLLGIPATTAAIVLTVGDALKSGCHITSDEFLVAGLTFVAGIVLYRMALGGFLLVLVYGYGAHLPPASEGSCGPGQPAGVQSAPAPAPAQ